MIAIHASAAPPVVLHTRVVSGSGGGPDKTILNGSAFLDSFGFRTICAYMHHPNDPGFDVIRSRARQSGARFAPIEDRGPLDLRVAKRLLDLCRRERVAIWHGHDYKSNALGLVLSRFWPMRLVSTVHGWGTLTGRTPLYFWIDRHCLRRYEKVVCVSDDLRQQCVDSGVSADRCVVIENAIDTQRYRRSLTPAEAKARLGLEPGRLLVGAVGRLSEEKNFHGLVRAMDRVLAAGIDAELVVVGDGDQQERLTSLIKELHREDRIRLLGFRSDTIDLYQAMDVFCLSSDREGLPNVLLEAMALRVPVLATRIAGVPRLVNHEANGLLVDPGDMNQLAEGLKRLLADESLRQRLAAAGRETIEASYSFDVRMGKIRRIYDELLVTG